MADDRTYIKLHDGMPEHPKVETLHDDAAAWLLVALWAYCSRYQTDGQVPKVKAHRMTKGASVNRCGKLVTIGLLHDGETVCCPAPKPEHYYCHDYLVHQRSAAQIEAMKEQRRNAGRNGGLAKGKRPAKQTASEPLSETSSKTEAKSKQRSEGSSNEEPQTEGISARKRAANKTLAPDDLPITAGMREWGQAHAENVTDPAAETRRFLDYHRAKGSAFSDWTAAWRNWMAKASEFAAERGNVRAIRPTGTDPHDEWGFD